MDTRLTTVTEYINSFPASTQELLHTLRELIISLEPNVDESISYGMPAYKTHGKPLVYFAAYKSHIGLYATPSGYEKFKEELSKYKQGKGSVQFPLTEELPLELIEKIILFRIAENNPKFNKL